MNTLVWKVEPNDDCTSRTADELFFFHAAVQRWHTDTERNNCIEWTVWRSVQHQKAHGVVHEQSAQMRILPEKQRPCLSRAACISLWMRTRSIVLLQHQQQRTKLPPVDWPWVSAPLHILTYIRCAISMNVQNGANKNPRQRTRADEITCQFFFLVSFFQSNLERKKNADKIKRTSRCGVQRDQLCRLQPTNQSHTAMCNGFRSIKVVRIGLSLIRKANFQPVTWVKSTTRARFHCRTWDNFDTDVWSGRAAIRCASIFWHLFAVYSIRWRWQIS